MQDQIFFNQGLSLADGGDMDARGEDTDISISFRFLALELPSIAMQSKRV